FRHLLSGHGMWHVGQGTSGHHHSAGGCDPLSHPHAPMGNLLATGISPSRNPFGRRCRGSLVCDDVSNPWGSLLGCGASQYHRPVYESHGRPWGDALVLCAGVVGWVFPMECLSPFRVVSHGQALESALAGTRPCHARATFGVFPEPLGGRIVVVFYLLG